MKFVRRLVTTDFILQRTLASSDPGSLLVVLQNIPVPAPVVSLFSLRVLDSREPSVKSCQPLDGLEITYVAKPRWSMTGIGVAVDGHTTVVDTIDYFFPHSLITSSVFGPQCEVVNHGS